MAKIIEVGDEKRKFAKAFEHIKEFLTWRNIAIFAAIVFVALMIIFRLYYKKEELKEPSAAEQEAIRQQQLLEDYQGLRKQYEEQGLIKQKTQEEQADLLGDYNKTRQQYVEQGLINQ